ncbi:hypothetical protein [Salinicoccus sp. HZC-1]|uniref:hypothetical protein n=1 Tax=Salinicoccus sp. HZC-1 TaxID=3385497 RepID=UPI00398B2B3E
MKNNNKSLKLASVLMASTLFLGACSNPLDTLANEINGFMSGEETAEEKNPEENQNETAGTEPAGGEGQTGETGTSESDAENETQPVDYSHLMGKGEETTLDEGTHKVGSDIPAGRYVITADKGIGNIFISNEEERSVLSTTLNGKEEAEDYGSGRALAFLDEGHSIEINGLEGVDFTPYEAEEVTELFHGVWVAGKDFPAGVYDISVEEMESYGSMEVYNIPDTIKARYSLGAPEYGGMRSFTASFEAGDIVELQNTPTVTITKRD